MLAISKKNILVLGFVLVVSNIWAQDINQFNSNGKRHGIWKKNYDSGHLRYTGKFNNGKEVGTFKFYENSPAQIATIIKKFSIASDSAYVEYYTKKGKLKGKGYMIGKHRVGKWMYYFVNGNVFSEENYANGKLDGVVHNYYPNGKLTEETYYKEGKKHGASSIFTEDGVQIEDVSYVEGKLHGKAKYFDLKGQLKETGMYKNGKRDGKWEFYIEGEKVDKKKRKSLADFKEN